MGFAGAPLCLSSRLISACRVLKASLGTGSSERELGGCRRPGPRPGPAMAPCGHTEHYLFCFLSCEKKWHQKDDPSIDWKSVSITQIVQATSSPRSEGALRKHSEKRLNGIASGGSGPLLPARNRHRGVLDADGHMPRHLTSPAAGGPAAQHAAPRSPPPHRSPAGCGDHGAAGQYAVRHAKVVGLNAVFPPSGRLRCDLGVLLSSFFAQGFIALNLTRE